MQDEAALARPTSPDSGTGPDLILHFGSADMRTRDGGSGRPRERRNPRRGEGFCGVSAGDPSGIRTPGRASVARDASRPPAQRRAVDPGNDETPAEARVSGVLLK